MDIKKTLENYIDELSSNSPTPGGGNVAALCGLLASSLGEMVCNLTIGKKKYLSIEDEIKELKEKLCGFKQDYVQLGKLDNDAFDKVMDAFKLPKDTDEEKVLRNKAIENATIGAAEVPLKVVKTTSEVLPLLAIIAEKGNQNSVSDAGVALSLCNTAAEGAFLNVLINYSSIPTNEKAKGLYNEAVELCDRIKSESTKLLTEIKNKLMPQ